MLGIKQQGSFMLFATIEVRMRLKELNHKKPAPFREEVAAGFCAILSCMGWSLGLFLLQRNTHLA